MNHTTSIRFVPAQKRKRMKCFVCDRPRKCKYFDPSTNSYICDTDVGFVMNAEAAIAAADAATKKKKRVKK